MENLCIFNFMIIAGRSYLNMQTIDTTMNQMTSIYASMGHDFDNLDFSVASNPSP